MNLMQGHKRVITIVLAFLAIGLEIYYSLCADSCSYLRGSLFGVPLQYIGMAYMVCLVILSILKKDALTFLLVSAGVGIEFYLIGFQIYYNTYCPYCLGFAATIFILYFLNFRRKNLTVSLILMAISLIVFSIFFKGSMIPTYTYTSNSSNFFSLFSGFII
ncbi:MAG: hypothetical protein ACYDHW_10390 [Syntrophorhabdaceae bacterium]